VFPGNGKQRWSEGRIAELERKIGQQALELDFFEGVLAAHRGTADAAGIGLESRGLPESPKEEMKAKAGIEHRADGEVGPGFPVRLLPVPGCRAESGSRHGSP